MVDVVVCVVVFLVVEIEIIGLLVTNFDVVVDLVGDVVIIVVVVDLILISAGEVFVVISDVLAKTFGWIGLVGSNKYRLFVFNFASFLAIAIIDFIEIINTNRANRPLK